MKLLDCLSQKEKSLFNITHYKKGDIIHNENDLCNEVYFIINGEIKIVSYSLNGDEKIISSLKKDDIFANALIFSSTPKYLGHVICYSDCSLLRISKENLLYLFQNNQLFLVNYINVLSQKAIELTIKNKLFSYKNIRERIISFKLNFSLDAAG